MLLSGLPEEDTPGWLDHDLRWRQAAVAIAGATSQPPKCFLKDKKAPHEMYAMLKKHVDSANTGIGRESIHREFHRCQPVPGRPIVEWFEKLISISNCIKDTDEAITATAFRLRLWEGLPPSFINCVEYQKQRRGVTLDAIMDSIKEFEATSAMRSNPSGHALATDSNQGTSYRGGGRGGGNRGRGSYQSNARGGGSSGSQSVDQRPKWCTYHGVW